MEKNLKSISNLKLDAVSLSSLTSLKGGAEWVDTTEWLGEQMCSDRYHPGVFSHFCQGTPEKCIIVCE